MTAAQIANHCFCRAAARVVALRLAHYHGDAELARRDRRLERARCIKAARWERLEQALREVKS